MKSGSSTESLDVLNTIIEEIDEISESAGLDAAGRKIIITIKNTMSDRHSAEKKFNELLEDYRTKVLSEVVDNWEGMSEEEQTGIMKLNNFFCGLHFMVALADCASEALLEAERCLLEKGEKVGAQKVAPSFCSVKESGTVRLIRTACNAIHKHGSQKAGVHIYFTQYLRDEGVNSMPLASFRGNRFNIIFYDAAGIYFLHEKLKVFLESYSAKNQLLTAVLADLHEPVFRAGCKALGLINKFITGPLWRILESNKSIVEMNAVYTDIRDRFKEWGDDATSLLEGKSELLEEYVKCADPVLQMLISEESEIDDNVLMFLEIIMKSFFLLTDRMLVDHLPGGIYDQPSYTFMHVTQSVPKTNKVSERDFALLDRFLKEKPNASTVAIESLILFSQNKTREWLGKKTNAERARLFQAARKLTPKFRKKYKERKQEIQQYRASIIQARRKAKEAKSKKDEAIRHELTEEMIMNGFWQTEAEIDKELQRTKSITQKKKKLKNQIKFRKLVLLQEYHQDKTIFQFSIKGKQLSVLELKQNLSKLVNASEDITDDPTQPLSHNSDQNDGEDPYIRDPSQLVGKVVYHTFLVDDTSKEYCTFRGKVTKQINVGRNKSFFNIVYDGFEDRYWTYQLLEDYMNGDLKIM